MDKQQVDPALWPLVEGFPPIDVSAETLAGFRAAFKEMSPMPDPGTHPDVRVEEVWIPGTEAMQEVRCLLFRPVQRMPDCALLHIHGGGYVMGSPEMDAPRNIELVRATGCAILSVDYRLAPEHPYPAALEDCYAALQWLLPRYRSAAAAARVGIIGESAGGGLAAALAILARDRRSESLAFQVLIYPMLVPPGQSLDAATPDERTGRHIWTRASNTYCWSAFLSAGSGKAALVGRDSDLRGLPPVFLAVGELDLFLHDNLEYVGRLLRAGCTVEAHVYPGAVHGFDRMTEAQVSQRFAREMSAFISRMLA